eukprot:122676_1
MESSTSSEHHKIDKNKDNEHLDLDIDIDIDTKNDDEKQDRLSAMKPPTRLGRSRSLSRNLLRDHEDSISKKEQKSMAQEMFNQMKSLKYQNEAMGYHGYSGYLQRHDSATIDVRNIEETENEDTEIEDNNKKHISFSSGSNSDQLKNERNS